MKGKVEVSGKNTIFLSNDWDKFVEMPAKNGFFVEAIVQADAIIDASLDSLLRLIYHSFNCQDLINETTYHGQATSLQGIGTAKILCSKTVIDSRLLARIRDFKVARNLVAHSEAGEYALVLFNQQTPWTTQEELDDRAENKAKEWVREAFNIWQELIDIGIAASEKKDYYTSTSFFFANPRIKYIQRQFPQEVYRKKPKNSTNSNNPAQK